MRKNIIILLLCTFLLSGCGASSPQKVDDTLMNHFPSNYQDLLEEVNPDVVSMQYLVDHADDYAVNLGSDRNDFFVIVKGTVTSLETVTYDDEEILSKMNEDMAALLRGTTSTKFFLDDCDTSMSDSDSEYDLELDHEYYFFVHVSEGSSGYRYVPYNCFDFE